MSIKGNIFARYSCVWDPNNIHTSPDANGNISCSPGFVYPDPDDPNNPLDLHLLPNSPCIDKGDPSLSYEGQTDIDGEPRLMSLAVDMGTDEIDDFRYYRFDEPNGLTAYDYGPVHQYDGVLMNDLVWEHGPVWEPNGVFNGALRFDGVDDYVEVPGYYGITGGNPRTCSAWIKAKKQSTNMIISWGQSSSGQKFYFGIRVGNEVGNLGVGNFLSYAVGGTNLYDGQWHHVACVLPQKDFLTMGNVLLYVDGQAEETMDYYNPTGSIATAGTEPVLIGGLKEGDTLLYMYENLMDDVRIYQTAWDANEVKAHYQSARVAQLRSEAVIYYNCNEGDGQTLNNSGSGGQQGTLYNGVAWSSGAFGKVISFDSLDDYAYIPSYNGISGTHARSVSVWFKTTVSEWQWWVPESPYNIHFVQWGHDEEGELWMVYLRPDRIACVAICGGGVYSSKPLNDGLWHNIVAVLEEGETNPANIKLYVDGQLDVAGSSDSGTVHTSTEDVPVHIGTWYRYNNGEPYFAGHAQGLMDEIRIYDKALTEDDVQIIYKEFEN